MNNLFTLTPGHFEKFKSYCLEYQRLYGLHDWKLYFVREQREDVFAEIKWDSVGRKATIVLPLTWDRYGIGNINEQLRITAEHELLHLLLSDLSDVSWNRNEQDITQCSHMIINKIQAAKQGDRKK